MEDMETSRACSDGKFRFCYKVEVRGKEEEGTKQRTPLLDEGKESPSFPFHGKRRRGFVRLDERSKANRSAGSRGCKGEE